MMILWRFINNIQHLGLNEWNKKRMNGLTSIEMIGVRHIKIKKLLKNGCKLVVCIEIWTTDL